MNASGQTPIGVDLASDDARAVGVLVSSKLIDLDKITKNTPIIGKNPLDWAYSKIFGGSYIHPIEMLQSKETEQALKECSLTENQNG